MEAYAIKKVQKLAKYAKDILEIQVRLIEEKSHRGQEQDYFCEIEIDLPGHNLEIRDTERAMDKAIDRAVERMKRLLIKNKEKHLTKKHREGLKARQG